MGGGWDGKVIAIMIRSQRKLQQSEFWIARNDLARAQARRFYDKFDETLEAMDFTATVHGLCSPLYSIGEKGRPPIDPVGYFKGGCWGQSVNLAR